MKICPANAIVGVSCRLPGSILSLNGLVQALSAPPQPFSSPPPTRWINHTKTDLPPHFGFIGDDVLTGFPFARYGLPRAEAECLDPTHRLILQLVWEALENARLDPSSLAGPRTGVYLGLGSTDWSHQALGPRAIVSAHAGTGAWSSVAAGRIAYTFKTTGPTLCVDTACSSGLVAAHLALRDLRSGTIDRAIVASANLLLDPSSTTTLLTLGALSPTGRCLPFDHEADGYVRSEGGVALVIENQNVHTQHTRVHGWVAGSAINHDGPSNGLTAPSARAQKQVLLTALDEADWRASSIDLMEAHGTGTPLGDPIEWQALREVYGSGDRPCRVGTLKGTHGHLEAASGLAGLLRVLATFRHGKTFPQPWLNTLNPLVSLEGTRLSIPAQSVDGPYLRAGVSAFGLSGTNAHLLVEAPCASESEGPSQPDNTNAPIIIGLSGPTREAVTDLTRHWEHHAAGYSSGELSGTAKTRAQERFRVAGVVSPGQSPSEVLALCAQEPIDPSNPRIRIGFTYTGQGAQLVNMALPLMKHEPIFQAAMEEVGAVYGRLSGHSLHEILQDEQALNHTSFTQPALFAVEWSLTQLFAAWHLQPDLVLGHSVGEIAAACTAGVFTMEEAMALAVARGQVLGDLPEGGSMAAIEAQPQELLPTLPDDVVIAGFNGPRNTTISGGSTSVQQVVDHWTNADRMARLLTVSHAFHSPRMAPASEGLRTALASFEMKAPVLPWFSTLTGKLANQTSASAAYWGEQLVRPVRFQEAVESAQQHVDIFVELGPKPVLSGLAHGFSTRPWLGTLHAARDEVLALRETLARLWSLGAPIDRTSWGPSSAPVDLPVMPVRAGSLPLHPKLKTTTPHKPTSYLDLQWSRATSLPREVGGWIDREDPTCRRILKDADLMDPTAAPSNLLVRPTGTGPEQCREVQAALAQAQGEGLKLWVLTTGMRQKEPCADAFAVWGLAACMEIEHPLSWGGVLDVDPDAASQLGELIGRAPRARLETSGLWVPRLTKLVDSTPQPMEPMRSALVLGGTGSIGKAIVRWLHDQGVPEIHVVARDISRAATLPSNTQAHPCDLQDDHALERLLTELQDDHPLDAVFHAAGQAHRSSTLETPQKIWEDAWFGRMKSLTALEAFLNKDTRVVAIGSVASIWGGERLAPYAAACGGLEGSVRAAQQRGLAWSLLTLGPWAGGGMVSAQELHDMRQSGQALVQTSDLHEALHKVLTQPQCLTLCPADWRQLGRLLQARRARPFLREITPPPPQPPQSRLPIQTVLEQTVMALLGRLPEPTEGFFDAGFDSLLAVELARRLEASLGRTIPVACVFDHPSMESLAAFLNRSGETTAPPTAPQDAHELDDPVVICAIACRFPGAENPDQFAEQLEHGHSLITGVPSDRFVDAQRTGGFVKDIDLFDPDAFGLAPREALAIDPQQRMLLETARQVLDQAGPATTNVPVTGVYVGIGHSEYWRRLQHQEEPGDVHPSYPWSGTGNASSFAAGRLAHAFGLEGPALTIDTACSSSLVALHLAMRALRTGECDAALVGGTNALLERESFTYLDSLGALSPSGVCHAFDARADGYVRGEGCGMILVTRRSRAEQLSWPILAQLLGSATGHDGHASGLTVPNGSAQERVIRDALADAGCHPDEVDYVEAHGTGTALGDPIELAALSRVHAHRSRPLKIGSLKPSIGHLEAASGIASVIKVVMALNRGRLPATIEHEQPTKHWPQGFDAHIVTTLQPWENSRIAGVSSFGLSGTNAHVVLSGPPALKEVPAHDTPVAFLAASAKTPERLDPWWTAWTDSDLTPLEQAAGLSRHPDQTFRRVQVGDRTAEGQVTARPSVGVLMNLSAELNLPGPCPIPAPAGMAASFALWARRQPHLQLDAQPNTDRQRKELATAFGLAALKQVLDWGIPIDAVRWVDPPDLFDTLWETNAPFASMAASPPHAISKGLWCTVDGEETSAPDVVIDLSLGPQDVEKNTLSALQGDASWVEQLLWCVGQLWVRGVPVDRESIHPPRPLLGAPPRPFVRQRLWADPSSVLPQGWRRVWHPLPEGRGTSAPETQVCVLDRRLSGPSLIHEALRHVRESTAPLTWVWTCEEEGWVDAPGCDALALMATLSTLQVEKPERSIRLWLGSVEHLETVAIADEDVVWMRAGVPHTPHLEATPSTPAPAFPLTGHWLVTGGRGALGQHVVHWLQTAGVRVTTVGRTDAPESKGTASHATVDVSDVTAFDEWLEAHGPFDGAVHCAGTSSQAWAHQTTLADLQQAYGAKVEGTRCLDASIDGPLIVFGSATAWFGLPGQTGYAAANATVEGIMHERHQRGLPGKCVVWGPWTEGMASDLQREPGTRFMTPKRAIQALSQSLDGLPSTAIFDLQPHRFIERYPRIPTWLRGWSNDRNPSQETVTLSLAEAHALVAKTCSQVLGQPKPLAMQQGFADAGMDSIMAVELSRRLSTHLGRPLSLTVAFDHPRVDKLAAHIAQAEPLSNATAHRRDQEPIAIVGMALRLPGANDVDELWQNLVDQHVATGTVPPSRWGLKGVEPAARYGAFLEDIDLFDPNAFGIAPREAQSMDPQQRLLLEVAWEALHRGGHASSLEGSRTGTFVGIADRGYLRRFGPAGASQYSDAWAGTGNEPSFAAGRIAHALGLTGPALSLNTTCSSSLVAIDLARRALLDGTCDQAIAGGVHLMLTPDESSYLSQLGALSPTGRCRSFDSRADGYVRAEGCGVVVMKRWSDAQRDGDPVHALILSSATNHDGRSSGLTVPNGEAQRQVIQSAWESIPAERGTLGLLQAHGTGTPLGDPIEYRAAQEALSERCDGAVLVRSIKANIGHGELAAGIAGLIDAVMCLERESIPPIPDLSSPNPNLPQGALTLAQSQTPWPRGQSPRLAGVSAFGLSGTNAHLVLAEAPLATGRRSPLPPPALERTRFWLEGDRFQSHHGVHHVAWSPTDLEAPYEGVLAVVSGSEPHPLAQHMDVATIHPDRVEQWLVEQTGETGLLLVQPATSQDLHEQTFEWMKIAQAAAKRPRTRLWFITQHGAAVLDEPTSPAGCLFAALARALIVEFPDLGGGWCDTDTWSFIDRRCLVNSRHLARRLDGTWTPTLQPSTSSVRPAPLPDTWVITGGLGALGLHTARGCVAQGATELHLIGRTALEHPSKAKAREDIAALIEQGCTVHTHAVDVTDQPGMMAVFESLSSRSIGIVHAAGITEPTPTPEASIDHVERVLRPKLVGANVLHACIQTAEVTHLICFGSIASVWGSRDLAAYAAANGWLEGWSRQMQSKTLTARCIQWGPWEGGGMIGDDEAQQLSLYGLQPLNAQAALAALVQTLHQQNPAPVVVNAEWGTLHAHLAHTPSGSLFEPLLDNEPALYETALQARRSDQTSEPIRNPEAAREIIQKEAHAILRLRQPLSPETPLMELGLDSLMATELRNVLAERGLIIPLGRLLGGPSVDEMVAIALAHQSHPASPQDRGHTPDEDVPHWMIWTHIAALVLGAALATGVVVLLQRLSG